MASPTPPARPGPRWPLAPPLAAGLAALLVAAALGLAFARVRSVGVVVLDDGTYLTHNARVLTGLTREGLAWAFGWGDGRSTYFHPVAWLSLMADVTAFGFRPELMHLENLALHAVSAVLLLLTAWRATGRLAPSLAAALLFGLHPLTVEAVAWITERKTVLSTALGMGAVFTWVCHRARPAAWRVALATALFTLSLLARPQLLVLPALLLLLDLWPLGRAALPGGPAAGGAGAVPWRRLLLEKWPLAAASALVTAAVVLTLPPDSATHVPPPPLGYRAAQAVASIADYLGAVAWPRDLVILRSLPAEVSAGRLALGAALLLGLTALAAWQARRRPWWLFGWLWFLTALSPALGLVQNGVWPAWADRFAYAPLLGLALGVSFGVAEVAERWPATRWAVAGAAALQPWSADLRAFHASALVNEGRQDEALAELEAAVRLDPRHVLALLRTGELLERLGRVEEAAGRYRQVLAVEPDLADAHFALGRLAYQQGWREEARRHLGRYVALAPVESGGSVKNARAWLSRLGGR